MIMTPDQQKHYYQVGEIFGPSPINDQEMFAGRLKERVAILDAILQRGQHAIIFGERGVGKTSLANMLSPFLENLGKSVLAPKASCTVADDYATLWAKLFSQVKISQKKTFFNEAVSEKVLATDLPEKITPQLVQELLTMLGSQTILIVIIDEFDRLREKEVFADTIKAMADYAVPVSIVLVGVADTVTNLITAHQSVARCLVQVHLRRMTPAELQEILEKGHAKLKMTMDDEAKRFVCLLSQGLPHYVHEIGRFSTRLAIKRGSVRVEMSDVERGLQETIQESQESMRNEYQKAVMSPQKDNLYGYVLLACAITKPDESGFFAAADVREPMRRIMNQADIDIPNFSRHLHAFCDPDRSSVLTRIGKEHMYRFRFSDPLMKPFVLIKAFTEGRIERTLIEEFYAQKKEVSHGEKTGNQS